MSNLWKEKICFYYNYFGLKRENGIDCVIAQEIADDINKSKANVSHDFANLIASPGRRNYGYNTTFIYKQLQKLMHLDKPCYVAIVGSSPTFMNVELLNKRNFIIKNQQDTFSPDALSDIQLLILTMPITQEEFNTIPENVAGIINLSGVHYNTQRPYQEIDMLSILSELWINTFDLDLDTAPQR